MNMDNNIDNFWSRAMAAEHFGMSVVALKKQEDTANANGYGLSEDFKKIGNVKLWHKDEWNKLQAARLQKYIDEAVRLGLVITTATHEDIVEAARVASHIEGYSEGVKAATSEVPVDTTHELNELEDVDATGYVVGGFQPLSSLGL